MRNVLIVEDNDDLRDLYAQVIADDGFGVLMAADGHAAIDVLERTGILPAFILLDLMMPGMDGWSFLKIRAQRKAAWTQIPVVVCSAAGERLPEGFEYIRKPLNLAQLHELLNRYGRRPFLDAPVKA